MTQFCDRVMLFAYINEQFRRENALSRVYNNDFSLFNIINISENNNFSKSNVSSTCLHF